MSIQQYQTTTPRDSNDALSFMTFHHQLCKKRAISTMEQNNFDDAVVENKGQEEIIQLYNLGYEGRKRRKHEKEENENNNAAADADRYQKSNTKRRPRNGTTNKSALSSSRWHFISSKNTTKKEGLLSSPRWNFISNRSDDDVKEQTASNIIVSDRSSSWRFKWLENLVTPPPLSNTAGHDTYNSDSDIEDECYVDGNDVHFNTTPDVLDLEDDDFDTHYEVVRQQKKKICSICNKCLDVSQYAQGQWHKGPSSTIRKCLDCSLSYYIEIYGMEGAMEFINTAKRDNAKNHQQRMEYRSPYYQQLLEQRRQQRAMELAALAAMATKFDGESHAFGLPIINTTTQEGLSHLESLILAKIRRGGWYYTGDSRMGLDGEIMYNEGVGFIIRDTTMICKRVRGRFVRLLTSDIGSTLQAIVHPICAGELICI